MLLTPTINPKLALQAHLFRGFAHGGHSFLDVIARMSCALDNIYHTLLARELEIQADRRANQDLNGAPTIETDITNTGKMAQIANRATIENEIANAGKMTDDQTNQNNG
jgi:hypothetical protein